MAVTPSSGVTGFGATLEAWNSAHTADPRYAAGAVYDPMPGLGPDDRHNDKYFGVYASDGYVIGYSMRLPKGTTFPEAQAAALAELPNDARVPWTATRNTCAQMELRSALLGQSLPKSIGQSGMVFVEAITETRAGDEGYNPKNANELIFLLGDYPKKTNAPGC